MMNTDRPDATTSPLPGEESDGVALDQSFTSENLFALRSAVAAHGSELGLAGAVLADLVLVAHELAANAVRHGGASVTAPGRLRLWREGGTVVCEVTDDGPGLTDPSVGTEPVAVQANSGRGIWIARQVAGAVTITTGAQGGTTVRITLVPPDGAGVSS
jgi:anti-sigma regulatory factor (Ser/Thr protein kinase)